MLTDEQVREFKTKGYLVLPNFYGSREVAAIQREVERFKKEGLLRNVATDGDGKTHSTKQRNLQICPMYHKSPLFKALPFDPKVVDVVNRLIGQPAILHLDQLFLKPPGDGMGTNWHQDNAYFKIKDPLKGTAFWVAVHDATIQNGTIHVIPEMFNQQLPHARDGNSDHHIRCWPDESKQVPCEVPAGSVVLFCYGTPHCTKANTSAHERAGAAFHFLHADYASIDLTADNRDCRPYITGPLATMGLREYGQNMTGEWERLTALSV
jgi:ectoine hydroxylase-related dioxygenase (phytanoyl-CoA dioxygenase family)